MTDLLLTNRIQHLRDRDRHYALGLKYLAHLVDKLQSMRETIEGLQQLRQNADQLANSFKRALYHSIHAAGGDFGNTRKRMLAREELVFSDYLKTLYSTARNIESHITHELTILRFYESETEPEPKIRDYVQQTKSFDQDIIIKNVDLMVQRTNLFNKTLLDQPAFQSHSSSISSIEL